MAIFKRIIKAGFLSFSRNGLVSWAAVLVTTITLLVIASILFLQVILNFSLEEIKNKVDITVYLTTDAPEANVKALQESLEKLPEVEEVTYTGAEEALQIFRERHQNDYPTIQALDELNENPLGGSLNIKAREIFQYESISKFLESDNTFTAGPDSVIYKVNYNQNRGVIDRLNAIIDGAQRLGFLVTLLLAIVSVIITFNTIRLTIFIARDEIGVMRLVGASKWRVRGPFMVEGMIYGVLATILTLVIILPITAWFGRNMTAFLGINLYDYYIANFIQILILVMLSGIILGTVSSYLAVRKYLNK